MHASLPWRIDDALDSSPPELAEAGAALADAIADALGPWVVACVEQRLTEAGRVVTLDERAQAEAAGGRAALEIGAQLRELLARDVDDQFTTPLALVRLAVRYPTAVLSSCEIGEQSRDDFSLGRFPDDQFDLTPASLAVLGDEVGELAIIWGATKAFEHKRRHRS